MAIIALARAIGFSSGKAARCPADFMSSPELLCSDVLIYQWITRATAQCVDWIRGLLACCHEQVTLQK
jgi:hypothetical protein